MVTVGFTRMLMLIFLFLAQIWLAGFELQETRICALAVKVSFMEVDSEFPGTDTERPAASQSPAFRLVRAPSLDWEMLKGGEVE